MADKKERAVRIEKDVFGKIPGTILSNSDIVKGFEISMHPLMLRPRDSELLVKVADSHKPITLSQSLYADRKCGDDVSPVNIPDFSKNILEQIQDYRIVDFPKKNAGGVYKVINLDEVSSNKPGFYVIAYEKKLIFTMDISQTNGYIAGPMIFREYGGISTFKHDFNINGGQRSVIIETCVPKRTQSDGEKLVKKLFLDFHRKLKDKCLGLGMSPTDSE